MTCHGAPLPTTVRWPAILFVVVTTLVLTVASGRGCGSTPQQGGAPPPHATDVAAVVVRG